MRKKDNDMITEVVTNNIKKPILKKSKFSSMSKNDWIQANNQTKQSRGIDGITYNDITLNHKSKAPHLKVHDGKVEIDENNPLQKKWFEEFKGDNV